MKPLSIIAAILGFIIVVPLVALGVFIATFDPNSIKPQLVQQASKSLGRDVALNGPIHLSLADGLTLSLADVHIGNPAGFTDKQFAKIGTLDLALNWQALLQHKVDVRRFALKDAEVDMITSPSGKNNWELAPATAANAPAAASAPQQSTTKNDFYIDQINVSEVDLENTKLVQRDERKGKNQEINIEQGHVAAPADGALKVSVKGGLNQSPFTIDFSAEKGLAVLVAGTATPIDLKANMSGQDVALKGNFARDGKAYTLDAMDAKVKGMDFTGKLRINTEGAVPLISGSINSPEINLLSLQPAKTAQAIPAGEPLRAIPIAAIAASSAAPDLSALKAANADIQLSVTKLIFAEGKQFDNLTTRVMLTNGHLTLQPLKTSFLGTPYEGQFFIDASAPTPLTHIVLKASNIDFPAVAKAFGSTSPVQSHGDLALDLTGNGLTPEGITHSLAGTLQLSFGAGNLDFGNNDQAATQIIKVLFPQGATSENPKLNCAAVRFNAQNGVLQSNGSGSGIVLDSNFATVSGEGNIDLASNQVAMVLRHVPKVAEGNTANASLLNSVPLKVSGDMAHVTVLPEEEALMQKASALLSGGGGGPVSTGVPKVDDTIKDKNACLVALLNPQMIMQQPASTKDVLKDTAKDAVARFKDVRDQVKGQMNGYSSNGATGTGNSTNQKPNNPAALIKGLFGH